MLSTQFRQPRWPGDSALPPHPDPIETRSEVARAMGKHFEASRAPPAEFVADEVIIQRDYVCGVPSMVSRYPIAAFGNEHLRCYERDEGFVVNDVSSDTCKSCIAYALGHQAHASRGGPDRSRAAQGRISGNPGVWTAQSAGTVQ